MTDLFGAPTTADVSTADVLADLRREQALRAEVHPLWVKSGLLTGDEAQRYSVLLARAIEIVEQASD